MYDRLRKLVEAAGLHLKEDKSKAIHRLDQGHLRWLGYSVSCKEGRIQLGIDARGWSSLEDKLTRAHEVPDSPGRAVHVLNGWLSHYGPCYQPGAFDSMLNRIRGVASDAGFSELVERKAVLDRCQ